MTNIIDHLSVDGDHLNIAINKHKGDRAGTESQILKPIYANPTNWVVCPIVAMAIMLLCKDRIYSGMDIFPEKSADTSFNDWLRSIKTTNEDDLQFDATNVTSHATRKGVSSYCVSLPGLSHTIQVWLRGGWKLGGVMPEYIKMDEGGQECTGRTACMLPNDTEFTLIAARFEDNDVNWNSMVNEYDSIPQNMKLVLKHVVPAVVYHADQIVDTLDSRHPLFMSKFWRNGCQISLKNKVLPPVKMYCPTTKMRATGIPPMIQMQYQNELHSNYLYDCRNVLFV